MVIVYISVGIVAISFAVLVFHLIRTFQSLQVTLNSISNTLSGVEKQIQGISIEATELLVKTNALADDINQKATKLNGLFESAKELGDTVSCVNNTIRKVTDRFSNKGENNENNTKTVDLSSMVMRLFDKWQRSKR